MSQRLGMADGRCFTINSSSQLYNNYLMNKNGVSYEDNYFLPQTPTIEGTGTFQARPRNEKVCFV